MYSTGKGLRTLNRFHSVAKVVLILVGLCARSGLFAGDEQQTRAEVLRHRVVVSTDIGGTDPDDFQSMVHLLVYADVLDIEGLISSPYGPGRKQHILKVIDCFEQDFANLKTHSKSYPTADTLRSITKQGEIAVASYAGVRSSTEGSQWLVECARRDDPRPLHVLVWGGIEDLAQALHDAPDILPKLRVYFIGGPNKKWSPNAYQYIIENHPQLWIIEANATYRGWFTGGNQSGTWGNLQFVKDHIFGRGSLGNFFGSKMNSIKMGDSPSVGWLLSGMPNDPTNPGWGGQFVHAWKRPYSRYERITTASDQIEVFGILELVLPLGDNSPKNPTASLMADGLTIEGYAGGDGTMRFRFCPKASKTYPLAISSNVPVLDGVTGAITVISPKPEIAFQPDPHLSNWWTDNPAAEFAEGEHNGAKSVSRWREEFLGDFAKRMSRCKTPLPTKEKQ